MMVICCVDKLHSRKLSSCYMISSRLCMVRHFTPCFNVLMHSYSTASSGSSTDCIPVPAACAAILPAAPVAALQPFAMQWP